MSFNFTDTIAIVTGAASGIGRRTAKMFLKSGATCILVDKVRNPEWKGWDKNWPRKVIPIVGDISTPKRWVPKLDKALGGLPENQYLVLANVAAVVDRHERNLLAELDLMRNGGRNLEPGMADLKKVFDVNYKAAYYLSLYVASKLIKPGEKIIDPTAADAEAKKSQRRGAIINVGSTNVFTRKSQRHYYVPMKAALHSLTELLAKELGEYGIRVNCVAPGATAGTSIVDKPEAAAVSMPLGISSTTDVANAILFFASDLANNITGEILKVDGGKTVSLG